MSTAKYLLLVAGPRGLPRRVRAGRSGQGTPRQVLREADGPAPPPRPVAIALRDALARSQQTLAVVTAADGGGE